MAITFAGSIALSLIAEMTNPLDLETGSAKLTKRVAQTFANGTGVNQAQQHWSDTRTLAATSETLDLAGALVNAFGATVTFAKIKAILIINNATTTGYNLLVGAAASNQVTLFGDAASDKAKIGPGGMLLITNPRDGYTITGGSSDNLKIDAGSNSVSYDIIIIGD